MPASSRRRRSNRGASSTRSRGGGFVVGLKTGLHRFDPQACEFVHLAHVEPHLPANRLNDACVSPDGALWFGSMHDPEADRPQPNTLAGKRVFVQIEEGAGWPDGTAVDQEGCVWIALWGGWGVRRYCPGGRLLATVRLPCANVTKLAFGGADLRTAYVTTAWKGMSEEERAAQPLAGDLFSFEAPAPGPRPVQVRVLPTCDGAGRAMANRDLS